MADVFISYRRDDRERVEPIASALSDEGITVFMDLATPVGSTWRDHIEKHLDDCRVVLVAWSKRTEEPREARWVLEEVDRAWSQKKTIVPVLLDQCRIPMGYKEIQAADLTHWDGNPQSGAWQSVRDQVAASLRAAAPQTATKVRAERETRFASFISYSAKDATAVARLHKALEGYKFPKRVSHLLPKYLHKERLYPIFRDREELAAGSQLGELIETTLGSSATLIVACSPRAAQSPWIAREILAFKQLSGDRPVIPVVLDGVPNSPFKEFDCFPETLRWRGDEYALYDPSRNAVDIRLQSARDALTRIAAQVARLPIELLDPKLKPQH